MRNLTNFASRLKPSGYVWLLESIEISPKINGKLRVQSFTYILGSQVLSPSHNFLGAYKLYLSIITSTFHLLYYPFLILYSHIFHPNIIFSSIQLKFVPLKPIKTFLERQQVYINYQNTKDSPQFLNSCRFFNPKFILGTCQN